MSDAAAFAEGDIVYMKAGSPAMTVEAISKPPLIAVVWFDAANVLHRDRLHESALTKDKPPCAS